MTSLPSTAPSPAIGHRVPAEDEVILADNLEVLPSFADECFQLIYIDPPFNTGKMQTRKTLATVPDAGGDRGR